jgi:exosortase/archaeosortase family protein
VPIAIVVNAMRVTITGILSEIKPELAMGFFHTAEGWIVFVMALALLMLAHKIFGWASSRILSRDKPDVAETLR